MAWVVADNFCEVTGDRIRGSSEVSQGDNMAFRGTDLESYMPEYTLVYDEKWAIPCTHQGSDKRPKWFANDPFPPCSDAALHLALVQTFNPKRFGVGGVACFF